MLSPGRASSGQPGALWADFNAGGRSAGCHTQRVPGDFDAGNWPNLDQVGVEGALAGEVGEGVRGEPVDVAAVGREASPAALGGDGDAGRHVVGDDGAQGAPAALVARRSRPRRRRCRARAASSGLISMNGVPSFASERRLVGHAAS